MCGGSMFNKHDAQPTAKPAAQDFTYSAPDLRETYKTFQETGQIPYRYYGAGAPTDSAELARVRAAYPGAFTAPATPAAPATNPQRPRYNTGFYDNPFIKLLTSLSPASQQFRDRNRSDGGTGQV